MSVVRISSKNGVFRWVMVWGCEGGGVAACGLVGVY